MTEIVPQKAVDGTVVPIIPESVRAEKDTRWLMDTLNAAREAREEGNATEVRRLLKDLEVSSADIPAILATTQLLQRKASVEEVVVFLTTLSETKTAGREPPPLYAPMLIADVSDLGPSIGALEIACRKLRLDRVNRFRPDIGEVMAAIEDAEHELKSRESRLAAVAAGKEKAAAWLASL